MLLESLVKILISTNLSVDSKAFDAIVNTLSGIVIVFAAELGITLFSDIDRYTLDDALVHLYYHLQLDDGAIETIPMGVFEVSEANRAIRCLEIKAFDYMLRFEKEPKLSTSSGTAYAFLLMACTECDVELEQTKAEIDLLPNGTETLGIYADNDIESYRDLLYYVAQVLGCFCTINRDGRLQLVHTAITRHLIFIVQNDLIAVTLILLQDTLLFHLPI